MVNLPSNFQNYTYLNNNRVYPQFRAECPTCHNETTAPWWSGEIGQEAVEDDHLCLKALIAMAVLNGPASLDDFVSACKQIFTGFKNKMPDGYDPKIAQHPNSFFRGTILHEYLNPNSEKCINKKFAKKIIEKDVSLRDTKFGKWILKRLGIEEVENYILKTNINDLTHTENFPQKVVAKVFKSKNTFGDLTARALTRTSKFGVYALGALGLLHAAHEISDGEKPIKQLAKTSLQVLTTLLTVGYLGAIGYKKFGALGSLVGTGLGTALGALVPKLLNNSNSSSKFI